MVVGWKGKGRGKMVGLDYFLFGLPKIDLQLHNGEKSGNKTLGQKCPPLMFKYCGGFCHFLYLICLFSPIISYTVFALFLVTSSVLHVQFLFLFLFFFFVHHFISFHFFFLCSFFSHLLLIFFFIIFSLICFGFLCYLFFLMKCPFIYNF